MQITNALDEIIKSSHLIVIVCNRHGFSMFPPYEYWVILVFHSFVVLLSSGSFEPSLNETFFSGST
jgi:hypothetical protein